MRLFGLIFVWFVAAMQLFGAGMQLGKTDFKVSDVIINLIFSLLAVIAAIGLMEW